MKKMNLSTSLISSLTLGRLKYKKRAFREILRKAHHAGIFLASLYPLYQAKIKKEWSSFCLPAFNLRGLTFDLASSIFSVAKQKEVGAFIFELARSEMTYTAQPPIEYAGLILAAALEAGWQGPIFLQGDHFQVNPVDSSHSLKKEVNLVKKLIKNSVKSGFYNIDIDVSLLLSLKENVEVSAKLVKLIRMLRPKTEFFPEKISCGVEVGEIGGKKTTEKELNDYLRLLKKKLGNFDNVTKVAIQSGTQHGGEVLPCGKLGKMAVDFELVEKLDKIVKEFGLVGVVQHGASTLSLSDLGKVKEAGVLEVHLATALQNLFFDHPDFPTDLKKRIENWLFKNAQSKRKKEWTDKQFLYYTRKYAWGVFERQFFFLPQDFKKKIREEVAKKVEGIFRVLGVEGSREVVEKYY